VPLGAGSDTPLGGTVSGVRIAGRHPGAQVDPLPTVCYLNRVSIDITELETHRPAITGHCYRMLGSAADAEDAAQDTFVRAWQSLHRFEGRSSLKTWLYRIATNVCLDALSDKARRFRPMEEGPAGTVQDDLVDRPRTHWLEPVPDARVVPADASPFERAALQQSIRLAFVAALQHLPPRQRAALLLSDVLGWSAAEVADGLAMSVAAVNSVLQRARATLAGRNVSLAAIQGANRDYILNRIPHISRLMVPTINEVLAHAQTIVIGNGSPEFADVPRRIGDGQTIIDFVRVCDSRTILGVYEGICW